MGLSYQEVVIALVGDDKKGFTTLKNFALMLGGFLTAILTIIAISPVSGFWFKSVSGLSDSLAEIAQLPLIIMAVFPILTILISLQRGLLVITKNTKPITFATAIEFITVIVMLLLTITFFDLVGAVAASIALVIGRIFANVYLTPPSIKAGSNMIGQDFPPRD